MTQEYTVRDIINNLYVISFFVYTRGQELFSLTL